MFEPEYYKPLCFAEVAQELGSRKRELSASLVHDIAVGGAQGHLIVLRYCSKNRFTFLSSPVSGFYVQVADIWLQSFFPTNFDSVRCCFGVSLGGLVCTSRFVFSLSRRVVSSYRRLGSFLILLSEYR